MLTDRELIERVDLAWRAAEMSGDVDALLSLATEDLVIQPPVGRAVRGRAATRALLSPSGPRLLRVSVFDLEIEIHADLAIKRARFETVVEGRADPLTGAHLWILRPRWLVSYVAWSFDAAPD